MEATLRQQAERYLGAEIRPSEWHEAKADADRKLAHIIQREGDADGERRKPYYLAQLIAEAVRASRFSKFTFELYALDKYIEEQFGVKKGRPTSKDVNHPISAPLL